MKRKATHYYDGFGSFNDQGDMPQASERKSKISPRLREEAAVYCSAMACWWTGNFPPASNCANPRDCGATQKSITLAYQALRSDLPDLIYWNQQHAEAWAEAEAMLRTGWEP